jgi:hypothetical protein
LAPSGGKTAAKNMTAEEPKVRKEGIRRCGPEAQG